MMAKTIVLTVLRFVSILVNIYFSRTFSGSCFDPQELASYPKINTELLESLLLNEERFINYMNVFEVKALNHLHNYWTEYYQINESMETMFHNIFLIDIMSSSSQNKTGSTHLFLNLKCNDSHLRVRIVVSSWLDKIEFCLIFSTSMHKNECNVFHSFPFLSLSGDKSLNLAFIVSVDISRKLFLTQVHGNGVLISLHVTDIFHLGCHKNSGMQMEFLDTTPARKSKRNYLIQLHGTEFLLNSSLLFKRSSTNDQHAIHKKDSKMIRGMDLNVTSEIKYNNDNDDVARITRTDFPGSGRIINYVKSLYKYVISYRNSPRVIEISLIGSYGKIIVRSKNNTINIIQYPIIDKIKKSISVLITLNKKASVRFNNLLDCPVITILIMVDQNIVKREYLDHLNLFVVLNGQVTFIGNMNIDQLNEFRISGFVRVISIHVKGKCCQETVPPSTDLKSYVYRALIIMIVILIVAVMVTIQISKEIRKMERRIRMKQQFKTNLGSIKFSSVDQA